MKDTTKKAVAGFASMLAIVTVIALGIPLADSFPTMGNHWKDNEDTKPVLDANATAGSVATYVYRDDDGEEHTKNITGQLDDGGATAHPFHVDLVTVGVDFASVGALTPNPAYDSDFDHYVLIKTKIPANVLYEKTVTSACFGFALERGDSDPDPDVQSYKVEVGAGHAVLDTVTVAGDSDTGDADTTTKGDCKDRDDEDDSNAEYEVPLSLDKVRRFLLASYVQEDARDVATFYVKVSGPRALVAGANQTEEGDAFDAALQFYTWDGKSVITYDAAAGGQVVIAAVALLSAVVMGKSLAIRDLNPFRRREEVNQ